MNNDSKIVMVVAELEDGREHIHSKNHKPLEYDLNDKKDLGFIDDYYRMYIEDKTMCYSKDLTRILPTKGTPHKNRVLVKAIRYENYDNELRIPYRTFAIMQ